MPQPSSEQPLNGQQMQAIHKQAEASVRAILADIELRKLALRHACDIVTSTNSPPADGKVQFHDPIKLAEGMHAFLTASAAAQISPTTENRKTQ